MKRKTFDKIVTSVGAGLTVFLLVVAYLSNWGATFAADTLKDQLQAQLIEMPGGDEISSDAPADIKSYFDSRKGELMTTGKDAQVYAEYYIGYHMSHLPTYAEAQAALRSATPEKKESAAATVETVFKGNMLKGTLLTAYAFGTLGSIAGYAALAALAGAILMLVLTIAGIIHLRRTPDSATI